MNWPETVFHQVWLWQWRLPETLHTTDGRTLRVFQPGWWNYGPGPDFQKAIVWIDGAWRTGDVEVHLTTTDWVLHRHDRDPRYGRVVLHVVYASTGIPVYHRDVSEAIPEVSLGAYISPRDLWEFPTDAVCPRRPTTTMCLTYLPAWSAEGLRECVEEMGYAYLVERARVAARAIAAGEPPSQTLYRSIARGLGYAQAKCLLEALARTVPWPLPRVIALSEGPAGLLNRWWHGLQDVGPVWPGPYRPAQEPWRRLAWLAVLCGLPMDPMEHLLQVAEAGLRYGVSDPSAWRRLWQAVTAGYTGLAFSASSWCLPDGRTVFLGRRLVGRGRWATLWWNAVVPVAMARWERSHGTWPSLPTLRAMSTDPIEDDAVQRAVRTRFGFWQTFLPRRLPLVQLGLHGLYHQVCNEPVRSCPRCPLRRRDAADAARVVEGPPLAGGGRDGR